MQDFFKLDITEEEAVRMDAEMERLLIAMKQANEKIAREQSELEEMQDDTRKIIAGMRERQRVETTF